MMEVTSDPLNGLLFINKPKSLSSSDALYPIKKLLRQIGQKKTKIGHFGTLDPFADGLLIIALGHCTRLADYVHEYCPKTYIAKGLFGTQTDTGDLTGQSYKECNLADISARSIVEKKYLGKYSQRPPFFSATKHQGKPLYEWAREGIEIVKDPVERMIYQFEINKLDENEIIFSASVSSGTYIRVLMEDIAYDFKSCGHLVELTRTKIGNAEKDQATELALFKELQSYAELSQKLIEPEVVLPFLKVELDSERECEAFRHGQTIETIFSCEQPVWVYHEGKRLGLAKIREGKLQVLINMMAQL